jgi:hypothetical protein
MFQEPESQAKGRMAQSLDSWARRHPGMFTLFLVLLTAGVTLGLLYKTGYALILYQGF